MSIAQRNAPRPPRTTTEAANVALVATLFDAGWGAHRGWETVWEGAMAPHVRTHFHARPPCEGLAAAIAFNADLFAGFPNLAIHVEDMIAEGDSVVVRARLSGRHEGPFLGVPATGAAVEVPDVTLFRLEAGKVVETRYFTDLVAVLSAIGAPPLPRA